MALKGVLVLAAAVMGNGPQVVRDIDSIVKGVLALCDLAVPHLFHLDALWGEMWQHAKTTRCLCCALLGSTVDC
jgi:hypothetical protein